MNEKIIKIIEENLTTSEAGIMGDIQRHLLILKQSTKIKFMKIKYKIIWFALILLAGYFIGSLANSQNYKKWYEVDRLDTWSISYEKIYDEDTNIVCYSIYSSAISCLKNN